MRMSYYGINNTHEYKKVLEDRPEEWNIFLKSLAVNVSEFFRNREVFDFFSQNCLPKIIEDKIKNKKKIIKFWSAGCSCGEEAYSLAILLKEVIKDKNILLRVYATDMDEDALKIANQAEYFLSSLKKVNSRFLEEYFIDSSNGKKKVKDEIRKIVIFKQHNLFSHPPLKGIDAIFCRNVRIYFDSRSSENVLLNIYNSLNDGGYIVIGKAEILPYSLRKLFFTVSSEYKIFQKVSIEGR
ncbi:MAG: protein-glutamate O-methyltransferase CheR [Candidatus Omnitrophica bacterium]|nr:protein-glutamate O-methyltransferase CheR [Candidatus Omnitrophota bacterium]